MRGVLFNHFLSPPNRRQAGPRHSRQLVIVVCVSARVHLLIVHDVCQTRERKLCGVRKMRSDAKTAVHLWLVGRHVCKAKLS